MYQGCYDVMITPGERCNLYGSRDECSPLESSSNTVVHTRFYISNTNTNLVVYDNQQFDEGLEFTYLSNLFNLKIVLLFQKIRNIPCITSLNVCYI